ncbi:unnamed protein product [Sphenostylis stenocarpa]|uniref:Uncharacterized protein n=1 Tax=Sphenostylis stenocarpa TaxID=92480 RepID=A0AA86VZM1_9FABA|nr:unnamed protein product [Sphenostylis stenocarpa]
MGVEGEEGIGSGEYSLQVECRERRMQLRSIGLAENKMKKLFGYDVFADTMRV